MWLISLSVHQSVAHILCEALESFSESVAISEDKVDQTQWRIDALTHTMPQREELETVVQMMCDPIPMMHIEKLPDKDWVKENDNSFAPLTIGPFYVHDSRHTDHLPEDKICLQIDASTAFGTGQHGTTQGCLEALSALHQEGAQFNSIIDIGTGTGILAIAATKLLGKLVFASDIDPEAISKATENVQLNDCQGEVVLIPGDGITEAYKPFDLVIANILANTLIDLAPSIAHSTHPGSVLILSGLLVTQIDSVANAYRAHHFRLNQTITHDEWATLILSKLNTC